MSELDYRLCFVDGAEQNVFTAYFTSDFDNQIGDDWNDAPYEHNAGLPYYGRDGDHSVVKIRFLSGGWETPCTGIYNSPYSVDRINSLDVPWLDDVDAPIRSRIYARTTLRSFILVVGDENILVPMSHYIKKFSGDKEVTDDGSRDS